MKRNVIFLVVVLLSLTARAQLNTDEKLKIDSLRGVIDSALHDTTKVKALLQWDNLIYRTDAELDLKINHSIDSISSLNLEKNLDPTEKQLFLKFKGIALGNLGLSYNSIGDNSKALKYLFEGLEIRKLLDNKKSVAYALNNIGAIYNEQGIHNKAIEYYTKSLVIHEEIQNLTGIGGALNNIAIVQKGQGNYESAISYYKKSLQLKIDNQDSSAIAIAYLNIGALYLELEKYDTARSYLNKSIEVSTSIKDSSNISQAFVNLGSVFHNQKKIDSALHYYLKGYQIQLKNKNRKMIPETAVFLGEMYFDLDEISTAQDYGEKALKLSFENDIMKVSEQASGLLYRIYKKKNLSAKSLEMLELNLKLNDSINSEKNQKEVIRQQYKYEYERQAFVDSTKAAENAKLKDAQLTVEKTKRKNQELQKYFLFGGLAIALLFGAFIFNRFKVTNQQKGIIEKQKKKVDAAYIKLEEKNDEILDSINYAKRIQTAILPPKKLINQYLKNSFVLYKPKAVVAGDFYWMEPLKEGVLFAAADCTGHGVPGAMVSVVCNNSLNRSVREFGFTEPGDVLDKTRELVIQEFEKSEEEVKDGMDIALCSLQGTKLKYAGANNPLWIIRKGSSEVDEIKADKQPIGKHSDLTSFTTHSIDLKEGDTFFTFSDGFADQFGGEKNKKFKTKNFKSLLVSIQNESIERQGEIINETFEEWRRGVEQLDDVCVIGVRV